MYLFAFLFLLISLLGLFTQVFVTQATQFMARQSAVGQGMVHWHVAAVTLAGTMTINDADLRCSLSTVGGCGSSSVATSSYLPVGDRVPFIWSTLLYTLGTSSRYVVTYVPPTAIDATSHLITSPAIGLSMSDLSNQVSVGFASKASYGLVQATATGRVLRSTSGHTMPMDTTVPLDSFAIVSQYK